MSDDTTQNGAGDDNIDPNSPAVEDTVQNPDPEAVEDETPEKTSRRKKIHEEKQQENAGLQNQIDELKADNVENRSARIEKEKLEAIKTHGINPENFDEEAFEAEKKSLEEKGLSLSEAIDYAVLKQINATKEEQAREDGRESASLPPTSTVTQDEPKVVKPREITQKLTPEEYDKLDLTDPKTVAFVKQYNDYWNQKEFEEKHLAGAPL